MHQHPKHPRLFRLVAAFALPAALVGLPIAAAERTFTIDPAKSKATFVLPATGHEVKGKFPVLAGAIAFDDATGAASGKVGLAGAKGDTENSTRDKKMHAEVLLSAKYPEIALEATRLEGQVPASGSGEVKLHGKLNLIGREHAVVLPAKLEVAGEVVKAKATLDVPFVDWGLEDPSVLFLKVEKVVKVTLEIEGRLSP